MAVKLRLMRIGKRHRPHYRVCVVDSRKPQGGAFIENIGHYDPLIEDDKKKITIDKERAEYWLSVGAQPTETVGSFLRMLQVSGLARPKKRPRKRPKRTARKAAPSPKGSRKSRKSAKRVARKEAKRK